MYLCNFQNPNADVIRCVCNWIAWRTLALCLPHFCYCTISIAIYYVRMIRDFGFQNKKIKYKIICLAQFCMSFCFYNPNVMAGIENCVIVDFYVRGVKLAEWFKQRLKLLFGKFTLLISLSNGMRTLVCPATQLTNPVFDFF